MMGKKRIRLKRDVKTVCGDVAYGGNIFDIEKEDSNAFYIKPVSGTPGTIAVPKEDAVVVSEK